MSRRRIQTPRSGRRGLTLIELMIGTLIAAFLTAAAFAFAAHETRLMGVSTERVELSQAGRNALDLIADDISQAGSGLGYGSNNGLMTEVETPGCPGGTRCFRGLLLGQFGIRGRAFNTLGGATSLGRAINVDRIPIRAVGARGSLGPIVTLPSQALGVRYANGSYATISDYTTVGGTHCNEDPLYNNPITFQPGELAILRHQDGIFARSVLVTQGGLCVNASCRHNCTNFSINADPENTYSSDAGSTGASYLGGELQGGLKTVVWFVMPDPNTNSGRLYRALFDSQSCLAPAAIPAVVPAPPGAPICAGRVTDYAEAVNFRVWGWDPNATPPAWIHLVQGPITTTDRIRVDVELVLRSRVAGAPRGATTLDLVDGTCSPNCGGTDSADRRAYRTTVEVANSGRMALVR